MIVPGAELEEPVMNLTNICSWVFVQLLIYLFNQVNTLWSFWYPNFGSKCSITVSGKDVVQSNRKSRMSGLSFFQSKPIPFINDWIWKAGTFINAALAALNTRFEMFPLVGFSYIPYSKKISSIGWIFLLGPDLNSFVNSISLSGKKITKAVIKSSLSTLPNK